MIRRSLLLVAVLVALVLSGPAFAAAKEHCDPKTAQAYVDNVAAKALQIIKDTQAKTLTQDAAQKEFRKILTGSFDIPTIARFTMGRYWRVATPAQQKEIIHLIQVGILDKYADKVLSFSGNKYTVNGSRVLGNGDSNVDMTVIPATEPPVSLGWRVRGGKNAMRVIDISVEGVSMSLTHREEFSEIISRNGGRVQALIDALKNKQI